MRALLPRLPAATQLMVSAFRSGARENSRSVASLSSWCRSTSASAGSGVCASLRRPATQHARAVAVTATAPATASPVGAQRALHSCARSPSRGMVVDADGTKLGEMSVEEARKLARKRNLEVKLVHKANRSSDNPGPDVYRIVDANAERRKKEQRERQEAKKRAEKRRRDKELAKLTKEVQLSAWCGEHDLQVKVKQAHKFLSKGLRVKVVIKHRRGQKLDRQQQHLVIDQVKELVSDISESHPTNQQGAFLTAMLDPVPPEEGEGSS